MALNSSRFGGWQQAGSIVWALKRLRGYLWGTKFRVFSDHKALESIGKVGNHNARVQRWLELLTAFDYHLEYRKGSANGNADFLSRLPEPATEHDRNGSTSLTLVKGGGLYLIRACGLCTPSSPIPGVGLGRLMPRTENNALGGLPFTLTDFCDFCTHGPRMRFDGLPTPSRRFVVRVSASTATVDSSPGRGRGSRAADYDFASVFAVPTVASEDSAEAPAATSSVAQPTPFRSSVQGTDPVEPTGPTAPVPTLPGSSAPQTPTPFSDRISTRTRRRSATAAGQAPPAVDYGFGPGGPPRPSSRRVTTLPRARRPRPAPPAALLLPIHRPARYHFRPTTTTRSLWELLSYGSRLLLVTRRLRLQGRVPSTTLLNCGSRIPSPVIRMPIGSANSTQSRRATPRYVTSLSAGLRPCHPTSWHATPRTSVPLSQTSRNWRVRVDYIQRTTTSSYSSVTRHCCQQGLTNPTLWGEVLAC